jgi:AhpC/TSA family
MIEVGTTAPDFELPNQDGESVKLSDLRGQLVVLYFYPKADGSETGIGRGTLSALSTFDYSRAIQTREAAWL